MLSRYKTGEVIYDCYNKNFSNNKRFHIYNTDNAYPCIKSQGALIVDGGAYIEKNLVVDDYGYLKKVDDNNIYSLINLGYLNAIDFKPVDPHMDHLDIFNKLQEGFVSSDGSTPICDEQGNYLNEDYYFKLLIDNGSDYKDNNLSINLIKKNDSDEEKTNLILDNDGNIICKNILIKDDLTSETPLIQLKDDGTIICKTLLLDGDNDFNIHNLVAENIKCKNPPIDNNDVIRKQELLLNYSNNLSISSIYGFINYSMTDDALSISNSNLIFDASFEVLFDKLFIKINNLSINYNNINPIYTTFKLNLNINNQILNNLNTDITIKFNVSTLYSTETADNGDSLLFETYLNLQSKCLIIQIISMPDKHIFKSNQPIILSYF